MNQNESEQEPIETEPTLESTPEPARQPAAASSDPVNPPAPHELPDDPDLAEMLAWWKDQRQAADQAAADQAANADQEIEDQRWQAAIETVNPDPDLPPIKRSLIRRLLT